MSWSRLEISMRSGGLVVLGLFTLVSIVAPVAAQQRYRLDAGQWRSEAAPEPGTPEAEIQQIRAALAAGQSQRAVDLTDRWMQQHENHPLLVEAKLLHGDALAQQGNYYDALYDYEYVIRYYPASEQYRTALEREYEIGRLYTTGLKRKFFGMRMIPAGGEGEELLIRIQERAPGSQVGERASLALADYYYDQGEMANAATAYELFLENYPQSTQLEWASLRRIQAHLARFEGPGFDPTGLIEAAQHLRAYQQRFPASAERIGAQGTLDRIDESLAQKEYLTGRWYERRGEAVSAASLYRRLVRTYPRTAAAERALRRLEALDVPLARVPEHDTTPTPQEASDLEDQP